MISTFANALLGAGRYPSVSAVLQQGLDFLWLQEVDTLAERAALQVLLQQRANEPSLSPDQPKAMLAEQS